MKKPMIIVPFDGYALAQESLLVAINDFFKEEAVSGLVSHIKLNDGIHQHDMGGPRILEKISNMLKESNPEVKIFLDLKIYDVSATLTNTLKHYNHSCVPDILTVSSACSVDGIVELRRLLPETKLAMVSTLTDISENECLERFGQKPALKILNDLENIRRVYKNKASNMENFPAKDEPFDLLVCSPHELEFLRRNLSDSYGFIVPGIRDEWMKNPNEHQKRTTGVREALENGATFVVMGAQMTKGSPFLAITPSESRRRTCEQIKNARASLIVPGNPLETLKNCQGYYESPKDKDGNYIGPVVGYAKKYMAENTAERGAPIMKNKVGFIYLNFAKAEQIPAVRNHFATIIAGKMMDSSLAIDVIMGSPMGGLYLAASLGDALYGRYRSLRTVFAEKSMITEARQDNNARETTKMVIDRHDILPGDNVIMVEDVVNNLSTAWQMKELIEGHNAQLSAIVCAFNRSGKTEWEGIPIISACDIQFDQYDQEDIKVVGLIDEGKIVLKPKLQWDILAAAMKDGSAE